MNPPSADWSTPPKQFRAVALNQVTFGKFLVDVIETLFAPGVRLGLGQCKNLDTNVPDATNERAFYSFHVRENYLRRASLPMCLPGGWQYSRKVKSPPSEYYDMRATTCESGQVAGAIFICSNGPDVAMTGAAAVAYCAVYIQGGRRLGSGSRHQWRPQRTASPTMFSF